MIQPAPPLGPKVFGTVGRLARDTRGATIVEFAIVALPFFAILFAVLSASLTFFAQQSVETVTATLGRSLLTGETRAGTMTKAQF
jgi:Flp pilus assembly protein TadG